MMVRDFEAGAAEKVGEHQAKVIRYRVGKGGNDDPIVTLWIDSHTGLPCKREVSGLPEKENFRITEHYSEIKLDPPVNAKTFELPR
jgi:outer membrane lipoprotein-sorting protein